MKKNYAKLVFLALIIAMLCISLITYKNLENYTTEVRLVRQSNEVIKEIQLAFSIIKDAEIGQRGYQLTKDTIYLDPYYSAIELLPIQFKKLDTIILDRTQMRNLDTLKSLTDNQFIIISTIIANTHSTHLFMDRYESRILERGKENMNAIRKLVSRMVDTEQLVYENRIGNESRYKQITPIALLVYTMLTLIGLVVMFTRILQALDRSRETQLLLSETLEDQKKQMHLMAERKVVLNEAEAIAEMGSWKWSEKTDELVWSGGLCFIYGKGKEDSITLETFLENVLPEDKSMVEMFILDVRSIKKGMTIDYRLLKQNGEITYLTLTSKPQQKNSNDESVVLGVVIDITESKLNEKKLKQYNEELERSNEELEQFAYAASHDLQEPLRKIRAFGDRLLSKFSPMLGKQGADYINRMQSSSSRMQLLIEDLLSFSRVSRIEKIMQPIDVKAIINEVKEDLDIQLTSTKSTLTIHPIPQFQGDRLQIKRLFQNLISNAVKFHKEDEKPHVEISGEIIQANELKNTISKGLPANTQFVRITVKDNGIGFDEKYTNKIFNIFQRLHGRVTYEGTGIGLAICKKIVSNHNGYIEAKSIEGVGSEFIVTLPQKNTKNYKIPLELAQIPSS